MVFAVLWGAAYLLGRKIEQERAAASRLARHWSPSPVTFALIRRVSGVSAADGQRVEGRQGGVELLVGAAAEADDQAAERGGAAVVRQQGTSKPARARSLRRPAGLGHQPGRTCRRPARELAVRRQRGGHPRGPRGVHPPRGAHDLVDVAVAQQRQERPLDRPRRRSWVEARAG